jgi:sugar diacid utilization regulator/putative methionine-R-sulfoxide reductase with GAF domain
MLPTDDRTENRGSPTQTDLVAALEERTRERNLLGQMIVSISTVHTLDEGLSSLLRFVVDATSCAAACMYLLESEHEELVLRAVSSQNQSFGFRPTIALGEGIVGQAARSLEQQTLREGTAGDALLLLLSSDEEENTIQSLLVCPVVSRDHRPLGVMLALSEQPHAFSGLQQASVQQTAFLASDMLEHVRAHETMQRRLDLLTSFSILSQAMGSGLALSDLLASLADLTRQMMQADLCAVLLLDPPTSLLSVQACSPSGRPALSRNSLHLHLDELTLATLHTLSRSDQLGTLSDYVQAHVDPMRSDAYKTVLAVPLLKERELLGLVYCYFHNARKAHHEDQLVLRTIANHAATAIDRRRLLDLLTHKNLVRSFFDLLLSSPEESTDELRLHASFLGLDLQHSHCVALMEIRTAAAEQEGQSQPAPVEQIAAHIQAILRRDFPGSLLYHQLNLLTCLIDLTADSSVPRVLRWLRDLHLQIVSDHEVYLSIGLSTPSKMLSDYRRRFAEAGQALQMGYSINAEGGVVSFDDLPLYQYMTKFSHSDGTVSHYQEMIEQLAAYDHTHRGTDRLLETLEAYLTCYGNKDMTAKDLGVHVNTLRQRLERIQEITGIDVQSREQSNKRFDLQLALRLYRLRTASSEP